MPSTQAIDLLKAAFEAFVDKVYILDRQGRYLYANPRGLQRLGLSAEAIIGRSWQELELAKEVRAPFEGDFQAVIASGKPIIRQAVYPGIRNNRCYEYLLSPIQDAADEVQMVVASVRDITVRKEAEQRAIKTQQRFRNLCEAAPDGIVLVGKGGIISLVNEQTERVFGYPRKELIGQPIEKLIPQRYHQQHKRHRAAYQHSPATREMGIGMELYGLRADGTEFPVEVALSPFGTESGAETIAVIRDITVRKEAEARARKTQQRFRNLCEAAPDGIVLVGKGGIISLVNKQTERVFGYPRKELIGQPIEKLIPQRYHQQHKRNRAAYQHSPTTREMGIGMELYGLRADGTEFPVEVAFSPFGTERGAETIAVIRDITVRKEAEKQIKDLNRSLQNKLQELAIINQELESFSYSVSHDLRAPLRAMGGFSTILWEDYAEVLDETGKHYLHRIQAASQRMGLLIDGLLQLSRINRHEIDRSPLDISAMAGRIVDELRQEQPEHLMKVHIQPGMTIRAADGKLVLIGLENLLANAWKYTRGRERPQLEFTCLEKEGEQVFIVRDNGVGFNQKYESKLFEVFQRLHGLHEFEGLGIGLATVQRIVRRHGGRIWAEGEEGKGAAFFFTLASTSNDNLELHRD